MAKVFAAAAERLSSINAMERSQLLSFLDMWPCTEAEMSGCLVRHAAAPNRMESEIPFMIGNGTVADDGAPARVPTSGLFHYERAFLDAAGTHIARELASAFGWAFSRDESFLFLSWIVPSSSSGDGWVTVAEVAAARTAIEETIRCPRDFPFLEVFQATTWAAVRVISATCPYIDWGDRSARLRFLPNTAHGGFMLPYEVTLQASSGEMVVSFPDMRTLPEEHLEYMAKGRPRGYLLRDVFAGFATDPCHEVIHLFQGAAKQIDDSELSWSAEHDASVVAHLLAERVWSEGVGMPTPAPRGYFEEVTMNSYRRARAQVASWNAVKRAEYAKLRDSYGQVSLCRELRTDLEYHDQVKTMLGLQAFGVARRRTEGEWGELDAHLHLMFRDRIGVEVHVRPIEVPDALVRERDDSLLPASPAATGAAEAEGEEAAAATAPAADAPTDRAAA